MTGFVLALFEKRISGEMQLQKYIVASAHAYDPVSRQNSEAFSM